MINYSEARQEAIRLTKTLGREVIVKRVDCNCDALRCYRCGGQSFTFECVFRSCGHSVEVEDSCDQFVSDECLSRECDECNFVNCVCPHHSVNQLKREHPGLRSLAEVEAERKEREVA